MFEEMEKLHELLHKENIVHIIVKLSFFAKLDIYLSDERRLSVLQFKDCELLECARVKDSQVEILKENQTAEQIFEWIKEELVE